MMRRVAIGVLGLALVLTTGRTAPALFHFAHISEVNAQGGGDPGTQYVEITMETILQNLVTDSILSAWDCTGVHLGDQLVVPGDVSAGQDVPWIMATTSPVGGITPDFVLPAANLPACGQVCWGAPVDGDGTPVDPGSWDHSDPTLYIDCVAYGGYTGTLGANAGTASPLPPGDGTFSLTRITDTGSSLADFDLRCPTPENNMEMVGDFGPCSEGTTTTTTMVGGTTTTTTTLPAGSEPLSGKKIDLRVKKGETKKLLVISKDSTLTLGRGNGSADDPVEHGGRLTIASSSAAGAFLQEFPLDGEWDYIKKAGDERGYKWKSKTSPIRKVLVKPGKVIKILGKGTGMGFDLDADPDPVAVELRAGGHRWCWSFGGETKFKADKRWSAKNAGAPSACGP
jgi:hypothetical protein